MAVIGGAALIGMGWKVKSLEVNFVVLNVLALMTALNAVFDLVYVMSASGAGLTVNGVTIRNDAAAFSAEVAPALPGSAWAMIWAVIALAMFAASAWYSFVQPTLRNRAEKRFFNTQARIRRKPSTEPAKPETRVKVKANEPFPWETWED